MLGAGNSFRNLVCAALVALALHLLVLSIQFTFQTKPSNIDRLISVELLPQPSEDAEPEKIEPETIEPAPSPTPQTYSRSVLVSEQKETSEEPTAVVQTRIDRGALTKFLQQEAIDHAQRNPDAVSEFSETFEERLELDDIIEGDSLTGRAANRGRGVFMTQHKNGKRTCYVEMVNLLDPAAGTWGLGRDCTPPEKFDLKLNEPNNGWMVR